MKIIQYFFSMSQKSFQDPITLQVYQYRHCNLDSQEQMLRKTSDQSTVGPQNNYHTVTTHFEPHILGAKTTGDHHAVL